MPYFSFFSHPARLKMHPVYVLRGTNKQRKRLCSECNCRIWSWRAHNNRKSNENGFPLIAFGVGLSQCVINGFGFNCRCQYVCGARNHGISSKFVASSKHIINIEWNGVCVMNQIGKLRIPNVGALFATSTDASKFDVHFEAHARAHAQ